MNQIFIETKNRLHPKVTEDGFILKGQTYYRLMNGYIQGFKIYTTDISYSIRFFQEALCLGIDKNFEGDDIHKFWCGTGPFSIGMLYFDDASMVESNPFGIEITPENYVNEAGEILVRSYNKYLFPWFERSSTIEKAYEETCLLLDKIGDRSVSKYSWLLQMGRWSEAAEFINKRIYELKEYERCNDCKIEYISDLENLFNAIIENNESFLLDYIHTKEKQTVKHLGLMRDFNKFNKKILGGA